MPRAELGQELASPAATFYEMLQAERGMYDTYLDYFACIDKKMPCESAAECFTEDTDITYHMKGQPLRFRGRASYVSFLKGATAAQEMTAHVVGQNRFQWIAGRPRLLTYVTVWQWFVNKAHLGRDRPADLVTIGSSEDDFAWVGNRWLISRRVVQPVAGLVAAGEAAQLAPPEHGAQQHKTEPKD